MVGESGRMLKLVLDGPRAEEGAMIVKTAMLGV